MSDPGILLHHASLPGHMDPGLYSRWLARLPSGRAARLGRRSKETDRTATLLGLALLLNCANSAGLELPALSALEFPPTGKPAWPGGPDFSISHGAGLVGCALAPAGARIGLDIEARGAVKGPELRLVTSASERATYADAMLTADDLWTAKEAVLKAAGADLAAAASVSLETDAGVLFGVRYLLLRPLPAAAYACTVAVTTPAAVVVSEADAETLLRAA